MLMRVAEENDFAEIVALANWAYRGSAGKEASWNREEGILEGQRLSDELLRAELAEKADGALLVFQETMYGLILGTAWVSPQGEGVWSLGLLTVRPDAQTGGLGRQFLAGAEEYVRERGGRVMRITVLHVRDVLMQWYERRGYKTTGETEAFPYGDERFGKPLREDLYFVVMEKVL